jgi:hypothetical protein
MATAYVRHPETGEIYESELETWQDGEVTFAEDAEGNVFGVGDGGEYLVNAQGDAIELISEEAIVAAEQEAEDEEMREAIDFNEKLGAIEWSADLGNQIEKIERRIGRELTGAEQSKLVGDAMQEPGQADLLSAYEDGIANFRDVRDDDDRHALLKEHAEDAHNEAVAREAEAGEQADEAQPEDDTDPDDARQAEMVAVMEEAADDGE